MRLELQVRGHVLPYGVTVRLGTLKPARSKAAPAERHRRWSSVRPATPKRSVRAVQPERFQKELRAEPALRLPVAPAWLRASAAAEWVSSPSQAFHSQTQ